MSFRFLNKSKPKQRKHRPLSTKLRLAEDPSTPNGAYCGLWYRRYYPLSHSKISRVALSTKLVLSIITPIFQVLYHALSPPE